MSRKPSLPLRVLVAGLSHPLEAEDHTEVWSLDPGSARGLGFMLELAAWATSCSRRLLSSERFLCIPLQWLCMRSRDPSTNPLPAVRSMTHDYVNLCVLFSTPVHSGHFVISGLSDFCILVVKANLYSQCLPESFVFHTFSPPFSIRWVND